MKKEHILFYVLVLFVSSLCFSIVSAQVAAAFRADEAHRSTSIARNSAKTGSFYFLEHPISLSLNKVPLKKVLAEISTRANIHFSYSEDLVDAAKEISLEADDITLAAALNVVFDKSNIGWVPIEGGEVVLTTQTRAQQETGTITGKVVDNNTNDALVGVSIVIQGTSLGAATDIYGKFQVVGIPERVFSVKVSCIGYESLIKEIDFSKAKDIEETFRLKQAVIEGEEVVVTGQIRGQQAAINQQLTANTIVNIVSEERIKELPDANAAEAIGRLSGVALKRSGGEANKIVLRGMSDRFGSITVDGVRIPPTDADSRGVDLSMISQGSLSGIELYKALTPDKDGDAVAGIVNLVTKNAPSEREIRVDVQGAYNKLNNTAKQYVFSAKYGERFFDDVLGVQISGNLERRDRSNENKFNDYDFTINQYTDYWLTNFTLQFTDEVRKRGGVNVILDINTPDGGSIKISNIYNRTNRDFITYSRNYPVSSTLGPLYFARDQEQVIDNFNSSINGKNNFLGLAVDWGLSFAQSQGDFPYDYYMDFFEPSANGSGMKTFPERKGPPELYISSAWNNFNTTYLVWAYYRKENNIDKEKTANLDLSKKYTLESSLSGELKIGGKYRQKNRTKDKSQLTANYETEGFRDNELLPDGTRRLKDFSGTRFRNYQFTFGSVIPLSCFLDPAPAERNLYDKYRLYPMISRDALRSWYDRNKNGISGSKSEYIVDNEAGGDVYNIIERVSAGYIMNTLNIGQNVTLIAGVRVENEDNDYASKFSPQPLTGYPAVEGTLRDTSTVYSETIWLPNAQLTLKPFDFMNVRLAAYKALARPDFNYRLEQFVARNSSAALPKGVLTEFGTSLYVGNPRLTTAKAWNCEISTSFYSNVIGLFTVSAFYKDIQDMFHTASLMQVEGAVTQNGQKYLDSVGILWKNPFNPGLSYYLSYPYNSAKPTYVWGLEIDHQFNLGFLPGLFKNFVLSYNISIVNSETYVRTFLKDKIIYTASVFRGDTSWIPNNVPRYFDLNQKLEGQPEFFGNAAIGYDIAGFSARLSVFFQGEYTREYSADRRSDIITGSLTRWDLAFKQQITDNISVMLNVNNLTNVDENTSIDNTIGGWKLPGTGENYGLTADIGVRVTF